MFNKIVMEEGDADSHAKDQQEYFFLSGIAVPNKYEVKTAKARGGNICYVSMLEKDIQNYTWLILNDDFSVEGEKEGYRKVKVYVTKRLKQNQLFNIETEKPITWDDYSTFNLSLSKTLKRENIYCLTDGNTNISCCTKRNFTRRVSKETDESIPLSQPETVSSTSAMTMKEQLAKKLKQEKKVHRYDDCVIDSNRCFISRAQYVEGSFRQIKEKNNFRFYISIKVGDNKLKEVEIFSHKKAMQEPFRKRHEIANKLGAYINDPLEFSFLKNDTASIKHLDKHEFRFLSGEPVHNNLQVKSQQQGMIKTYYVVMLENDVANYTWLTPDDAFTKDDVEDGYVKVKVYKYRQWKENKLINIKTGNQATWQQFTKDKLYSTTNHDNETLYYFSDGDTESGLYCKNRYFSKRKQINSDLCDEQQKDDLDVEPKSKIQKVSEGSISTSGHSLFAPIERGGLLDEVLQMTAEADEALIDILTTENNNNYVQ